MASVGGVGGGGGASAATDVIFERRTAAASLRGRADPTAAAAMSNPARSAQSSFAREQLQASLSAARPRSARVEVEARSPSTVALEERTRESRAEMAGIPSRSATARADERAVTQRVDRRQIAARVDERTSIDALTERSRVQRAGDAQTGIQRLTDERNAVSRAAEPWRAERSGRREGVARAAVAVPAADDLRSRMAIEGRRTAETLTEAAAQRAMREYNAG